MTFVQHYSGSGGNLYEVTANSGKRLLIECGVTWSKLQKALNYNVNGIVGCLVTHEHQDHSKAIKEIMRAGIDVYASKGTADALSITGRKVNVVSDKTLIRLKDFDVLCFGINHDAAEPLGFVIRADNEFLFFATDTSHIKQRFKYPFTLIAIECGYDRDVLEHRLYTDEDQLKEEGLTKVNETLAKRLLTSHMEKQEAMRYLQQFVDLSKCREIHLLHMSGDNIDKAQAKKEFEERFFIETRIVESAYINHRI